MAYLKSIGVLLSFLTVFFYCAYNAASVYSNIWLSDWSNDATLNVTKEERTAQRDLRLGVYGLLGFVQGRTSFMLFPPLYNYTVCNDYSDMSNVMKKPVLSGLQPGLTQTGLGSYRD